MEMTGDSCNLNLLVKPRVLLRQSLITLAIAVIDGAILLWISAEQVKSLHMIAPWYLRVVIASNFRPFMLISVPMSLVLLVMIVLFSVPSSIP